jgi:threonine/homoserine/homoserine lactone efflux protein
MITRTRKAKGWKRVIVAFGAILCLALAALMALVPDGEGFFRHTGKWILASLMGIGGLWLAYIGLRGDTRQVGKTLDEMSKGL